MIGLLVMLFGLVLGFQGFPIVLLWPLLLALTYLGLTELFAGFSSFRPDKKSSS